MKTHSNPIILIVGPTAVGKTEIAIQLAEQIKGEIISADSRLFYRGMDIGTAKPSNEDMKRIPHHLINIVEPDETLSLAIFQQKAHEVIAEIIKRGKLPILVGGTGQYIRALINGWKPAEVKPDEKLRGILEGLKEKYGEGWLHAKLNQLDPDAALKIDSRNVRRTIRALEVILTTGRKFSDQQGRGESRYHLVTIGLIRSREDLYARVDARIEEMFTNGLIEEVKGLLERGFSHDLPSMSAIGYRECIRVIKGEWSIEQAKVEMRRVSRVFVRRQANWFKLSDPAIKWFNLSQGGGLPEMEEYIRTSITNEAV